MPTIFDLARQAATLGIATLSGWLFQVIGVPLPWFLGPIIAVGLLSLAGAHLATPPASRQTGQILLGSGIGLQFTPTVAAFLRPRIFPACRAGSRKWPTWPNVLAARSRRFR